MRFGIRHLLLITTACAVLSLFLSVRHHYIQERNLANYLHGMGAQTFWADDLPYDSVCIVNLVNAHIQEEDVARLKVFSELSRVDLGQSLLNAKALENLPRVDHLLIVDSPISEEQAALLVRIKPSKFLHLERCEFSVQSRKLLENAFGDRLRVTAPQIKP